MHMDIEVSGMGGGGGALFGCLKSVLYRWAGVENTKGRFNNTPKEMNP